MNLGNSINIKVLSLFHLGLGPELEKRSISLLVPVIVYSDLGNPYKVVDLSISMHMEVQAQVI